MNKTEKEKTVALITGLNGFTGRHLYAELKHNDYEVIGIGHEHLKDFSSETYVVCDLLDIDCLTEVIERINPDIVFHLAAITFVPHGNAEDIYKVNIVGTRNLLEVLAKQKKKPRSVLLASSANIYGNCDVFPITEDQTPNPVNDYAVSKLSMEYMARLWMDTLPITVVRPFNYTGVGQAENFLVPKIVSHFRKRASTIELGNVDVYRDFSDVRMVVDAYVRLSEANVPGTYNICSGLVVSLRDIVLMAEEISGHRLEVRVNPKFVRKDDIKKLGGSAAKLEKVLGSLKRYTMKETIRWMLESS